jgi:hypothetical protein
MPEKNILHVGMQKRSFVKKPRQAVRRSASAAGGELGLLLAVEVVAMRLLS